MNMAEDIKEAQKKLEDAEQASDPLKKAEALKEGMALLNDCLAEENISPAQRNVVSQLRFTYTRLVLSHLLLQQSFWLEDREILYTYFELLFVDQRTHLGDEVLRVLREHPELTQPCRRFFVPLLQQWLA